MCPKISRFSSSLVRVDSCEFVVSVLWALRLNHERCEKVELKRANRKQAIFKLIHAGKQKPIHYRKTKKLTIRKEREHPSNSQLHRRGPKFILSFLCLPRPLYLLPCPFHYEQKQHRHWFRIFATKDRSELRKL